VAARRALIGWIALVAVLPATASAKPCPTRADPRVVAAGNEVVVYRRPDPGRRTYSACVERSERRTLLVDSLVDPLGAVVYPHSFVVRGRYVAFVAPVEDRRDFELTVAVYDAVRGRLASWVPALSAERYDWDAFSLGLGRGGVVAWVLADRSSPTTGQVYAFDRRGRRFLGSDAAPDSLTLKGSVVRWRSLTGPHALRLRGPAPPCRHATGVHNACPQPPGFDSLT
jgi:hypothetical protein